MIKRCPKCNHLQEDARLIVCPSCKVAFEEEKTNVQQQPEPSAEDIAKSMSGDQLERIADSINKSRRFKLAFIRAFIISILISVPTVMVITISCANKEIQKKVEVVRKEMDRSFAAATNETALKFQTFVQTTTNQITKAYDTITNQITDLFREPRIRKTVEDVAGKEAKEILKAEVQPTVTRFRDEVEFLRLATRARAYDFRAYLRLLELKNGTNDLAHDADAVLSDIDRDLERDRSQFMPRRKFIVCSGTNYDAGPFTSDELASRFAAIAQEKTPYNREGFVNAVGDLKRPAFLASLVGIFTNETDLGVADRVTIAISTLAREDFHPRDYERIQVWWHSHEAEYTNWPFSEYSQGLNQVNAGNFTDAVKSLEQVLKVDPAADMSRALMIFCLVGMGQTNRAADCAKEFQLPTGRWAKWAAARVQLETGSVSNATVQFATLAKENPIMEYLPTEGYPGWSKIDWQLFRKASTQKP